MNKIPWTEEQVKSLNKFQESMWHHPFTCGKRDSSGEEHILKATADGWRCPKCEAKGDFSYHQDWCHSFMADWSWENNTPFSS